MAHENGGSIALLHKKEYRATRIQNSKPFKTIEYGSWETTIKNRRITIIGIYHPLIGTTTSNPHVNFLEEVSQLVQYFTTNHQNLVLLCGFNIHTQNLGNPDTLEYNIELQLKNQHEKLESSRHRNFKAFNLKPFTKEFNNDGILQQTSLENTYKNLHKNSLEH